MMLLKKGADGNRQDRDGETPFLNASDSCKKALHEFGFQGDMSTTDEARDKAEAAVSGEAAAVTKAGKLQALEAALAEER